MARAQTAAARRAAETAARAPKRGRVAIDPADEVLLNDALGEDDDDEDEGDDAEDGAANALDLSPEDKAQLEIHDLCEQFSMRGSRWTMKFRRIMRPEDANRPGISPGYVGVLPNTNVPQIRNDMLEEDMFGLWGGGTFDAEFFVDGKYQRGLTKRIDIQGPARPRGQDQKPIEQKEVPGPAHQNGFPSPQGPMTRDEVAKLMADTFAAEAERRRIRDLESELARLRAAPPQQAPGNDAAGIVNLVFEKVATMSKASKAAEAESPELAAIRAENAATKKKLEKMEDDARARGEAENKARYDRLERLVQERNKKRGPLAAITHDLLEVTAIDSAFGRLTKRAEEEGSGGILGAALKIFEAPIKKAVEQMAKNMVRSIKTMQNNQQPQGAPEINLADWQKWVAAMFQEPQLVANVDFVKDGLARFGPLVSRMIGITERATLLEFAKETMDERAVSLIGGANEEQINAIIQTLGVLRQTVVHIASSSPQEGPGDEDGDDEAEEPEEDEEEDDDESDENDVKGKVVS